MYFNKIQCFCFEEQILNPGESVDMPVFFFIDPDVDEDPNCFNMEAVALNYTFHRVQSMEELPRADFISFLKLKIRNFRKKHKLRFATFATFAICEIMVFANNTIGF